MRSGDRATLDPRALPNTANKGKENSEFNPGIELESFRTGRFVRGVAAEFVLDAA